MKTHLIFGLFFSILTFLVNAQSNETIFAIDGTINIDTGKILLMPVSDSLYYPFNSNKESVVRKGKFFFYDSITYPCAFRFGLKINSQWRYISDIFFIHPGQQFVLCNIDSVREIPFLSNSSMKELKGEYANSFNSLSTELHNIEARYDSLYNRYKDKIPKNLLLEIEGKRSILFNKRKTILLEYTKEHTNSYVALWKLIKELSDGYEPIYDSIYAYFSDSIKHTFTGIVLAKKLSASRVLAVGTIFPKLLLLDTYNNQVSVPIINNQNKYLLIDFWFSHCGPCLKEFQKYKEIYKSYKNIGFEIIGISVDKIEETNYWRKIITIKGFDWLQYLDQDGKVSKALSVNSFPTNFLINRNGVIIRKNVSAEELEQMLQRQYCYLMNKLDNCISLN